MKSILFPLMLIGAIPLAAEAQAQTRRVAPVETCASDRSFVAFRNQLRQAIERRDARRLLALVSDDIRVNFGGDAGRADFSRQWGLNRPQTSQLWQELGAVLRLGCARAEGGGFVSPSLNAQLGENDDPFETVVAVVPGSTMHARADARSPVVRRLQWDVLRTRNDNGQSPWVRVTVPRGPSGYVRRAHVRSPVDYRAYFRRTRAGWRMDAFLAGD